MKGGGFLSNSLTGLVPAHEAGDACAQNDIKGDPPLGNSTPNPHQVLGLA